MKQAKIMYTSENFPREGLNDREIQFLRLRFSGEYSSLGQVAEAMGYVRQNISNRIIPNILKKNSHYSKDMLLFQPKMRKNKEPEEKQLQFVQDDCNETYRNAVKYTPNQLKFLELRFSGKYHSMKEIADAMGKKSLTYVGRKLVKSIVDKGEYTSDQLLFYPKRGNGKRDKKTNPDMQVSATRLPSDNSIMEIYQLIPGNNDIPSTMCDNPFHDAILESLHLMVAHCAAILGRFPWENAEMCDCSKEDYQNKYSEPIDGETPEEQLKNVEKLLSTAMEAQERVDQDLMYRSMDIVALEERIQDIMNEAFNACSASMKMLYEKQAAEDAILKYTELRQNLQKKIEELNRAHSVTFEESLAAEDISLLNANGDPSRYGAFLLFSQNAAIQDAVAKVTTLEVANAAKHIATIDQFVAENPNVNNIEIRVSQQTVETRILKAYYSLSADERCRTDVDYQATVVVCKD